MNDAPSRPVPRWLHVWAVLTAAATLVLLALGQLVTSFQAGMADPIWPTEPWYLFVIGWQEPSRGYLIEHTHRIAAFAVGGLVSVLALGLWWTDPRRGTRWAGIAAILVLLAGFGQFHGGLIAQRDLKPADVRLPMGGTVVTLIGLVVSLGFAIAGLIRRSPLSGLRFLGVVALVGVMIQGLLGGVRVMLDALLGTDLATLHGIFAQIVFCLLLAIAVLSGRRPTVELSRSATRLISTGSVALVLVLFFQVVLGAFVRHAPTPLTQRLHFLTAFVALGLAVWVLVKLFGLPAMRVRVGATGGLLFLLLGLQVVLGVEAWMEKFGTYTLPELVKITDRYAAIRTAHALVGSALLGCSVVVALRVLQPSIGAPSNSVTENGAWYGPAAHVSRLETAGAGLRGTAR